MKEAGENIKSSTKDAIDTLKSQMTQSRLSKLQLLVPLLLSRILLTLLRINEKCVAMFPKNKSIAIDPTSSWAPLDALDDI